MVQAPGPAVVLCGTEQPPARIRRFELGLLGFDLEAGKLRYIRLAGVEALRCIAFVVRGPGWESPAPQISDLQTSQGEGGLAITYKAEYETSGGRLEVKASIRAPSHGGLVFEAEALALTDFTTARTSFCILHPIAGVAGRPLNLTRPDETVEHAFFPDSISPHQPFLNIRALSHEVMDGVWATVRMEGDIWEMEDQRNWTDASFKTYGRPRDIPWPYTIPKGERVIQRTILSFAGMPAAPVPSMPSDIEISIAPAPAGRLPKVALALSPGQSTPDAESPGGLSAAMAAAASLPAPPQALVAWYAHGVQGLADLQAYAAIAGRLGAPVELEAVLPCRAPVDQELAELASLLRQAGLQPASLLAIQAPMTKWVLKPPEEMGLPGFAALYAAARACFPGVAIGAGVTSNFTELNIDRPSLAGADFVTHCTAGVIHEPDDRSVMETLETLPHIFRSVREIAGGLPYRIGPSAIGMRYNPYGATTEANHANLRVAFARQDPRQRGLFGAAFAVGYFARAAAAGIDSICFGALTGPFGLVYRRSDYPQPWFDEQAAATAYPLFHPVTAFAAAAGATLFPVESSEPKRVLGLAYQPEGKGRMLWLANLTAERQTVHVEGGRLGHMRLRLLDEASFAEACLDPAGLAAGAGAPLGAGRLALGPYAVAALSLEKGD